MQSSSNRIECKIVTDGSILDRLYFEKLMMSGKWYLFTIGMIFDYLKYHINMHNHGTAAACAQQSHFSLT